MATKPTPSTAQVNAWEDDPGPAVEIARPAPDLSRQPLAYAFPHPQPAADKYQPGTAEFRYWTAAEALRRGADFWAPLLPVKSWQPGRTLSVKLDEGEDLNAFYDRQALNFFHGPGADGTLVFSGESPDVACHEMGHAILDAVKPDLWDAASQEAAAFHEGFGDISAILSALQLQSLRIAILNDTGGHLYRSSRLSRLAEQLGAAIRAQSPDAVEPDCLRNAVNSFTYSDPAELPSSAPASHLSSEPHSFSRVMSGAVFECLAGMLTASAADAKKPTEQELARVSTETGKIVIDAVVAAHVAPNFFAQVAAQMVQVSGAVNAAYPPVLRGVFVRRSILSLESVTSMAATALMPVAAVAAPAAQLALPGTRYGLAQPLLVQAPAQPRHFAITSGAPNGSSVQPPNALEAATAFVDDLFRNGRVDDQGLPASNARLVHTRRRLRTHRLKAEAAGVRLERQLFDCGFCCR
ncbi:hypothetical protein CCS01_26075 [Rhodopila globiformis]|uniref:Peptidase M4 domain-containing protein n=2 Tax=Rhodopila globiformis TaxID=1071 RepID=A0A2S6MZV3_RHOGL|nr:hypothetical protein CCS01_26075 [Rhodopila globiformis]